MVSVDTQKFFSIRKMSIYQQQKGMRRARGGYEYVVVKPDLCVSQQVHNNESLPNFRPDTQTKQSKANIKQTFRLKIRKKSRASSRRHFPVGAQTKPIFMLQINQRDDQTIITEKHLKTVNCWCKFLQLRASIRTFDVFPLKFNVWSVDLD